MVPARSRATSPDHVPANREAPQRTAPGQGRGSPRSTLQRKLARPRWSGSGRRGPVAVCATEHARVLTILVRGGLVSTKKEAADTASARGYVGAGDGDP